MAGQCCAADCSVERTLDRRYRRVLTVALVVNASMFFVEIVAGFRAGSVSLQADSLDFFGDAANYGISLFVLGMGLRPRARAALVKGLTMGLFGLWVLGAAVWHSITGAVPQAFTMGAVGFAALAANLAVLGLLWAYRNGDSNMRSVWICSRNDVAANIAVLLAAVSVFGTGAGWPDAIVAGIIAFFALQGAWHIIWLASGELQSARHELRSDLAQDRLDRAEATVR
jgi:Co/Zn/Cd efflux system component